MNYSKNSRAVCVICKRKRNRQIMKNVFHNSWACHIGYESECSKHQDIKIIKEIMELNSRLKLLDVGYLKTATNLQQIKL